MYYQNRIDKRIFIAIAANSEGGMILEPVKRYPEEENLTVTKKELDILFVEYSCED